VTLPAATDAASTRTSERAAWWAAHRRSYNIALVLAAPVSFIALFTIWGVFEDRLPCLEINGVGVFLAPIVFSIGLGLANICYSLGPLSEWLVRPNNPLACRRWTYRLGLAFSLLLVFEPPLINLLDALRGPLPCTDKLGRRHGGEK
jgi:hypothetical protein